MDSLDTSGEKREILERRGENELLANSFARINLTIMKIIQLHKCAVRVCEQAEVLMREREGRLELALQEQRLGLKPSMFLPKKGTRKRRM